MAEFMQFQDALRSLEACNKRIDAAVDNGVSIEKFKSTLMTSWERDSFGKLREQCQRYIQLYDELDTIPDRGKTK